MKLHPDQFDTQNIAGYGPGWIEVITAQSGSLQRQKRTQSFVLGTDGLLQDWRPQKVEQVQASDFDALLEQPMQVLLVGSGQRQHFFSPAYFACFYARQVGVEIMDTVSACRTYNVLAQEGRKVVAALLLEP